MTQNEATPKVQVAAAADSKSRAPGTWSFMLIGAARCFGKGCRRYVHQGNLRGLFLFKGLENSMDVNALVKKVTSGAQGNHGTLSTVLTLARSAPTWDMSGLKNGQSFSG